MSNEVSSDGLQASAREDSLGVLRLNSEKYRKYLDGHGLDDRQKDEYLEALWKIMSAFVDLEWEADPVQTVLKAKAISSQRTSSPRAQETSNQRMAT